MNQHLLRGGPLKELWRGWGIFELCENFFLKIFLISLVDFLSHQYFLYFAFPSHTFSVMVDPNTVNSVILFSFLGPAIDANGGLEYLNLSWNHFRGKGGVAIGKGLRANCSLQTLDISWNGLADEGAAAFGESLKENNTLIDLDLTNNRISTEGALAFAKGLQINNTLKILRFVT